MEGRKKSNQTDFPRIRSDFLIGCNVSCISREILNT